MKPSGLLIPEFDDATHTYTVDGKPVPGVTTILRSCGIGVNAFWTEKGREFGKAVHAAIHYEAEGDLDPESLSDSIRTRIDAYVQFCDDMEWRPDLVEQRLYSRAPRYAGTPDQVQNGRAVIDLKTGSPQPETALQLAAYALMLPNPYMHERWAVHLLDTGKYSLKVFPRSELQADFSVFQGCINIWNWKERHNGNGNRGTGS